jgi:hypothetical protein
MVVLLSLFLCSGLAKRDRTRSNGLPVKKVTYPSVIARGYSCIVTRGRIRSKEAQQSHQQDLYVLLFERSLQQQLEALGVKSLNQRMADRLPSIPSLSLVPRFSSFGADNCGLHDNDNEYQERLQLCEPENLATLARVCEGCKKHQPVLEMHRLPCGHALCLSCLCVIARHVPKYVAEHERQILYLIGLATFLEQEAGRVAPPYFFGNGQGPDPAAGLLTEANMHRTLATTLAGMTCCGTDMGLINHISCLQPDAARGIYVASFLLHTPSARRLRCGWADCGQFVPPLAIFGTAYGVRWRCVSCGGVSLWSGRQEKVSGAAELMPAWDPDDEASVVGLPDWHDEESVKTDIGDESVETGLDDIVYAKREPDADAQERLKN